MKDPKENAFIINIDPSNSSSHSQDNHDSPHGRAVMDQSSIEDGDSTKSTKSLTPEGTKKASKIRLWLETEAIKIRKSRTRQALIVFSFVVAAVLLGVLIWLETSGHIHEILKKSSPLQLNQGTYLGEVVQKSSKYARAVEAYRGIPYAQSTAGQNRFRPPQPLNGTVDRNNVQRAVSYGHVCPQNGGGKNQGEDCLNVNIFRPHFSDDPDAAAAEMAKLGVDSKKMPIVIYIHGGGFNSGSGAERNMLSFVAWSETPLIGMSFNYRVGALGFLPGASAAEAGLLNLGLKDQQALFQWVQNNAADFGGDANNVTIMGLSAGAHSVGHHLISYSPANKLTSAPVPFQKAILESGGSTARATFVPTHPLHEQQLSQFLEKCGLNGTSGDKLFDGLRALPLDTVVTASNYVWRRWNPSLRWAFQPVIDGSGGIIPDLPSQSWEKGNVLRIPILTGFNTNEGAVFVPSKESNSSAMRNLMSGLIPALNKTDLDTLNTMYPDPDTTVGQKLYVTKPPAGFGTQFWRLDDVYAHYAYICPVLQTAHLASTAKDASPVYAYHYAARSNSHGGADHGDEAPIVTHDMDVIGKYPGIVAMADAMTGFWSRFVVTGDPNPGPGVTTNTTTISWPKFVSPFNTSTTMIGVKEANSLGKVTLFGQGNDERMGMRGRQNPGVAAQIGNLTLRVRNESTFWWGRTILSEGFGNGSTSLGIEQHTKARL
ncbi:alpha/beta-hydrolase [Hypoxylon trugodes]|uniref:alpha/beta-hydrolase n=1 Tax=Hypoxylon trugodes TaxID=326681 RepID=UPI0021A22F25|nr:alpha/beta-hydrolase [Hypoxylon trugodes]KAI1388783.1 alpha/beta-hydrolase [Hypoxylon trugodes]